VFFDEAKEANTWRVDKIKKGEYRRMPYPSGEGEDGETAPLLQRVRDQI